MSKKTILISIIANMAAFFVSATPINAQEDFRAMKMHTFLENINSPMIGYEAEMIATADKYGLDWAILAAIAGTESSFGKHMPYQCINPYGWGIYGESKLCFKDYSEAIQEVGKGIGTRYNTSSLETIARKYNTASTSGWISHTRFFINKIKSQQIQAKQLAIEL